MTITYRTKIEGYEGNGDKCFHQVHPGCLGVGEALEAANKALEARHPGMGSRFIRATLHRRVSLQGGREVRYVIRAYKA